MIGPMRAPNIPPTANIATAVDHIKLLNFACLLKYSLMFCSKTQTTKLRVKYISVKPLLIDTSPIQTDSSLTPNKTRIAIIAYRGAILWNALGRSDGSVFDCTDIIKSFMKNVRKSYTFKTFKLRK